MAEKEKNPIFSFANLYQSVLAAAVIGAWVWGSNIDRGQYELKREVNALFRTQLELESEVASLKVERDRLQAVRDVLLFISMDREFRRSAVAPTPDAPQETRWWQGLLGNKTPAPTPQEAATEDARDLLDIPTPAAREMSDEQIQRELEQRVQQHQAK